MRSTLLENGYFAFSRKTMLRVSFRAARGNSATIRSTSREGRFDHWLISDPTPIRKVSVFPGTLGLIPTHHPKRDGGSHFPPKKRMESTEPALPLRDQGELFSPEKEHPLSFLT